MIASDQPTCFPGDVQVRLSSRADGTMLDRPAGIHDSVAVQNRREFCKQSGIPYDVVVYQNISYDNAATYNKVVRVGEKSTTRYMQDIAADALVTSSPGVGLFLPLADCIGLVLYEPTQRVLALAHIGRHSTLTDLVHRVVEQMSSQGAEPENIIAWMTPSAQKQSYRMEYFEAKHNPDWRPYCRDTPLGVYLDLVGYNRSRLLLAGLVESNVHMSTVDTVVSPDYFSHFAGDSHGRFAVLARIGENLVE